MNKVLKIYNQEKDKCNYYATSNVYNSIIGCEQIKPTKLYQDVTKWNKIYQANKSQILDPSLVFPAQVLDIPEN